MATGIILLSLAAASLVGLVHPAHHSGAKATPRIAASPGVDAAHGDAPHVANPGPATRISLDTRAITATLRADTAGLQGSYGVAVTDLSTGAAYGVNADLSYRAASINKMPILIALYQRAGAGGVNLDQSINLSEDDIQHYGTGLIQDANAPRTYTLRELAAAMIETSDNTAAFVLERFLGQDTIQMSLNRWNVRHTSMAANATTPADTTLLFESLYRNLLLPSQATDVALTLLQHTVFSDRLASGIPAGVPIAHKVGSDMGVFNDAGLVLAAGHPYAVTVLSQDADETEAQQAFLRVSKDIYRFEMSLPPADAR
jgi:beta-lactamase class A